MRWMLALSALLTARMAWAAPQTALPDPYGHVTLSASASVDVPDDLMRAELFVEEQGKDPAALADKVNREMQAALRAATAAPGVRAQSAGYDTEPVYVYDDKARQTRITGWRIRQSLRLESRDFTALKKLVGRLQGRLKLDNLSFTVSPKTRQDAENQAIVRALAAFRARAALIQGSLKAASWRIEHLDVNTPDSTPPLPPRPMMAAAAGVATPAAAPGDSTIEVVVTGDIHLSR